MTNKERFETAFLMATGQVDRPSGIGTLGEKTLHAVLKQYFEPDQTKHEVKIGRYVADIARDDGIVEIQTQSFQSLRRKLEVFLEAGMVTVVYPIPRIKWLCWIDGETGEVTKRRKSPKTGTVCDSFFELYKIKNLLTHPNLRLCLVLLELTEYRRLDGWSADRKKGSTRQERIPTQLLEEVTVCTPEDYKKLIPSGLPRPFTTKDVAKAARLSHPAAQRAVNVLYAVGAIQRVGKVGNSYLYEQGSACL